MHYLYYTHCTQPQQTKQIAGRAGRYSAELTNSGGTVSALTEPGMQHLRTALAELDEPVPTAGLLPSLEQLEVFAEAAGGYDSMKLDQQQQQQQQSLQQQRKRGKRGSSSSSEDVLTMCDILTAYARAAQHDESLYHLCEMNDMLNIARAIEKVPLPLATRYQFLLSPTDTK
jgi:Suv3 C-terminal domain 1